MTGLPFGKAAKAKKAAEAEKLAQEDKEWTEKKKAFDDSKKYKVLRNQYLDTSGTRRNQNYDDGCLEKDVNEHIELGWRPQGGVFMAESLVYSITGGILPGDTSYDYCQVMVRD